MIKLTMINPTLEHLKADFLQVNSEYYDSLMAVTLNSYSRKNTSTKPTTKCTIQ
jgi:hypothetical protein